MTLVGTKRRADMDLSRSPILSEATDACALLSDSAGSGGRLCAESLVETRCGSVTACGLSAMAGTLLICIEAWI